MSRTLWYTAVAVESEKVHPEKNPKCCDTLEVAPNTK
jgi:hypothetical protein